MHSSLAHEVARYLSVYHPRDIPLPGGAVEYWDSRIGVSLVSGAVDAWLGTLRNTSLTPKQASQRPDYAADSTHFRGRPVIKQAFTGSKVLRNLSISPSLWGTGTKPWVAFTIRMRTTSQQGRHFEGGGMAAYTDPNNPSSTLAGPANTTGIINGANWTSFSGANDTNPHVLFFGPTASSGTLQTWVDGICVQNVGSGLTTSTALSSFVLGALTETGTQAGDWSIAAVLLCDSPPSAAEINAYTRAQQSVFGTRVPTMCPLPSSIVEYWDCRFGVALSGSAITAWTGQVRGISLLPPGVPNRPTYGDDTYENPGLRDFGNWSVVRFAASGSKSLIATGISPSVAAASTRPWLGAIGRGRNLPSATHGYYLSTNGINGLRGRTTGDTAIWNSAFSVTNAVAVDALQHMFSTWLDGTNLNHKKDSSTSQSATAASMTSAITTVAMGQDSAGGNQADLSVAAGFICTAPPSAGELTAINSWITSEMT